MDDGAGNSFAKPHHLDRLKLCEDESLLLGHYAGRQYVVLSQHTHVQLRALVDAIDLIHDLIAGIETTPEHHLLFIVANAKRDLNLLIIVSDRN